MVQLWNSVCDGSPRWHERLGISVGSGVGIDFTDISVFAYHCARLAWLRGPHKDWISDYTFSDFKSAPYRGSLLERLPLGAVQLTSGRKRTSDFVDQLYADPTSLGLSVNKATLADWLREAREASVAEEALLDLALSPDVLEFSVTQRIIPETGSYLNYPSDIRRLAAHWASIRNLVFILQGHGVPFVLPAKPAYLTETEGRLRNIESEIDELCRDITYHDAPFAQHVNMIASLFEDSGARQIGERIILISATEPGPPMTGAIIALTFDMQRQLDELYDSQSLASKLVSLALRRVLETIILNNRNIQQYPQYEPNNHSLIWPGLADYLKVPVTEQTNLDFIKSSRPALKAFKKSDGSSA